MERTIGPLLSVAALMLGFTSMPQSAAQTITTSYSFTARVHGLEPAGPLVRNAAGNIYGVTTAGGDPRCVNPYGCGTVSNSMPRVTRRSFTTSPAKPMERRQFQV